MRSENLVSLTVLAAAVLSIVCSEASAATSKITTVNNALNPVPYTGVQFVAIPRFQEIGSTVGQQLAGALAGQMSPSAALANAQRSTTQTMMQAGYLK